MRRRTVLAGSAALAAALPRFAIGQSAKAMRQKTLRFVPQAAPASLDPVWTTAAVTANHSYNVYDTLYAVDATQTPQPQMAEGHTVSDDSRTWLITLRSGLRFHDNEPVLARDCAASIARWAKRDTFGGSLDPFVDEYGAADDRTIRIRLKSPFPLLIEALAKCFTVIPFMMPERIAKTDPFKQISEIVGSGPYRFLMDEYVPGSFLAYRKFDGYVPRAEPPSWASGGKIARMERVEWKVIPDAATASAALQAGEIDWWEQANADLLPVFKRDRHIAFGVADPTMQVGCLRFNHLHPPFNNVKLRLALLRGVKQEDYMGAVTGNDPSLYKLCPSYFPCGTRYGRPLGASVMTGDIEAAKREVAASGYAGEAAVIINPTDFPSIAPFGEITNELCGKIGIKTQLVETDWGTVVQRRASKEPTDRGGWSIFHTWWTGAATANPVVSAPLRGQGEKGWFGWFKDDRIEQLTAEWLRAPTDDERQRLCDQIQEEAFRVVPSIQLGQFFIRSAYRSDLEGVLEGPAPYAWNVSRRAGSI
jgi:peptide/nickel transport system substrate-binding protein